MKLNIPEIYKNKLAVFPVDKNTSFQDVFEVLSEGNYVVIEDLYSTGLKLLDMLKRKIGSLEDSRFKSSREARLKFRELSHRILLEVEKHKLLVRKAPDIPWFEKLYSKEDYFAISFPDVQGLNSSWQWYTKGVSVPGLSHKVHPWYGVYFPSRFEHIELFNKWLQKYSGNRKQAYDVGCGSGILSFLLENNGFEKIVATDINPNAVKSTEEEIAKQGYVNINPKQGYLFAEHKEKADLIVFNPPWLPEKATNLHLDQAVYYNDDLFSNFFEEAKQRLKPGGKIVLLFSNLFKLTHPNISHPIENELTKNNRFKLDIFLQKPVSEGSDKTKRNTKRRAMELIELWVINAS